ncbi:hypothetical protein E8E14_014587 [Neopestalotiopsis sp. 37M]|nr:hypothetical protein E8E14_014587 [Neopestalotiopsis sp. 37M]
MTDYDEDTIVQLITELSHLLIKLCTIEEDQVAFPPDGGHRINEELCESLHIDSAVVSLMKRLPYPKKHTVRIYCLMNGPPRAEEDTQERLDDHFHYRNWCHQDAPTYLRDLIDKVKALESIPCGIYPDYLYYDNVTEPEVQQEMKQIIESYGWPDQFRRDEWKSNMEKHWDDAI